MSEQRALQKIECLVGGLHSWRGLQQMVSPGYEPNDEALRRRTFIRVIGLTFAGPGICPGCMQKKEVFGPQRAIPGTGKERCLDCWKAER